MKIKVGQTVSYAEGKTGKVISLRPQKTSGDLARLDIGGGVCQYHLETNLKNVKTTPKETQPET